MEETAPAQAASGATTPGRHHRHAAHAAREARRRRSQRLILAIALAASLVLLLAVSFVAGFEIRHLSEQNDALANELFHTRQKLARLEPELEKARRELANATRGRLPHLMELTPDKVIEVNAGYVKNIVFTVLRQNGQIRHECRVVVENAGDGMLRPEVKVFVFDARGVQVGSGEITDRVELVPGESRAYSAVIERFMEEEPRYFYVWARRRK